MHLPVFVYLDDYPEIAGRQSIPGFLDRKAKGQPTPADLYLEKMCKVADLDPGKLQELQASDTEQRSQLVNRASAVVSQELQARWSDRRVDVRFNVDGDELMTVVSDSTASFAVDVNLNDRSRGFQWFFGFYMSFAADTQGGDKHGAILLLDEPGLYLHAKSQGDLLRHLKEDFANQILYSTHSPFTVPIKHLDWIRTVNIAEEQGTTVTNDPTGDYKTLFPLQAALGYELAQSLFVGGSNLIVEGVTEFWILSAVSTALMAEGREGLDGTLTITPAGGAQKVPYMASLLVSQNLDVLVLLDHEREGAAARDDLVKRKFLREQCVLSTGDAFAASERPTQADIEDLLDAYLYERIVRESYASELKGHVLTFDSRIPRLAKRAEATLRAVGIELRKSRPAKALLEKLGSDPMSVLTTESLERFERLFGAVNTRLAKHRERDGRPFI